MFLISTNLIKYENVYIFFNKICNNMKLDTKDRKILELLNNSGRASVSDISRKTGIPRDSVNYRLQKLIKSKIIKFFHTVLDPLKLGYPVFTYVNFNLHNFDEEKENRFYNYLSRHPNIIYVAKTTGKWDCMITISSKNLEHFDEVLKDIRKNFSDIIKEFDTTSIIKEYKYDYMIGLIK